MSNQAATVTGALLEARNIERSFALLRNQIHVLRGVDLAVQEGEAVAIMGASGAGKSTLLHILGGLDRPSAGQVLYQGQDLYRMSQARRTDCRAEAFGFVFQAYHLLPELTLAENVLLPVMRQLRWLRQAGKLQKKAYDYLAQVGLGDRVNHRPVELSGGEQQRASLARALMNEPRIVLADEPTGNLDSQTGETVLNHLFALTKEAGRTLVLVTHNQAVADRCDRTVHMVDGLIADATLAEG